MKTTIAPLRFEDRVPELRLSRVVGSCMRQTITALACWSLLAGVPISALLPRASAQADAGVDEAAARFRALVNADPFAGDESLGVTPDPLATDRNSSLADAELPTEDELLTQRFPVVDGEVLDAIAGVREREHRVSVELTSGLALIRHELTLESTATHAAEVRYRLALPAGAIPFSLEVCAEARGCRTGQIADPSQPLSDYDAAVLARGAYDAAEAPIAALDRSEDGRFLMVRASAIEALATGGDGARTPQSLIVRVAYSVPLEARGGVVRLSLPARGVDVRVADGEVRVHAEDLVVPRVDGVELEAGASTTQRSNQAIEIEAMVPRTWMTHADAWTIPCRAEPWALRGRTEHCTWVRAMSSRSTADVHNVVLALDVSPSMDAGASGLVPQVAMALLTQLPPHARVRLIAFAARGARVVAEGVAPSAITEDIIHRAMELPLGSATRFEALHEAISPWLTERDLRVVWIGDGGMTRSARALELAAQAHAAHVDFELVSVASRPATAALVQLNEVLGGHWVAVHEEALRSTQNEAGRAALREVVAASLASASPQRLVVSEASPHLLPAGASVAFVTRAAHVQSVQLGATIVRPVRASGDLALAIAARAANARRLVAARTSAPLVCAPEGVPVRPLTARVTRLLNHFGPAERRSCGAPALTPAVVEQRASLPSRALYRNLLRSVVPQLRECFRADRRGRAAYSIRAQLMLLISDQEVQDVRVEGDITDVLRTCMVSAIDALDVPAFDGAILARWPLHTEPSLPAARIELHPDLASAIDEFAPETAIPSRPSELTGQ